MLTKAIAVIVLQYIDVSNKHIVHLNLTLVYVCSISGKLGENDQ